MIQNMMSFFRRIGIRRFSMVRHLYGNNMSSFNYTIWKSVRLMDVDRKNKRWMMQILLRLSKILANKRRIGLKIMASNSNSKNPKINRMNNCLKICLDLSILLKTKRVTRRLSLILVKRRLNKLILAKRRKMGY